jgi:hypothetical protein
LGQAVQNGVKSHYIKVIFGAEYDIGVLIDSGLEGSPKGRVIRTM